MQNWALTDPGCVRLQNQDTYLIEPLDRGTLLCVVCDGMGGAKSGNVASSLAAEVFVQEVKRSYTPLMDQEKVDRMLQGAVKLANFTVYDQSEQFEEFTGMGTTLVSLLIRGKDVTVVNVGDSRAYCVDRAGIHLLTVEIDLFHRRVERGDCLLLCSDGLSNMMDDQEILFEVAHGINKQYCCQRLLEIAKNRGAPDNVTSVLVQI